MAITLTRMEGKLDSVVEKVSDLRTEVTQHRADITALKSTTQQIQSDMQGAEAARVLAAAAVKAAEEARMALVQAETAASVQRWTPVQRLYATLGACAALVAIVYYVVTFTHH
ncbi:MAG: hypothetical protein HY829_10510 [Actinobacteria bacterium]|nr:hypothetical protein [Actinomycetota bacterium]